jgi:hypothetical protein
MEAGATEGQANRRHVALRYGLQTGVPLALVGYVDVALQYWRQILAPSWRPLAFLALAWLAASVVAPALLGFFVARSTGRLRTGVRAGSLAAALTCLGFGVGISLETILGRGIPLTGVTFMSYTIVSLIFAGIGAVAGVVLAAPGGWFGRRAYRKAHPEEVARERAASQSARRRPRKPFRTWLKEEAQAFAIAMLLIAAVFVLAGLAYLAGDLVHEAVPGLALPLAVAAVVVAVALYVFLWHIRRPRVQIPRDWLVLLCLLFIVRLLWPDAFGFAASLGGSLFFILAVRHGVGYAVSEIVAALPPVPEPTPVVFRDDGERIVIYLSRNKLAAHAALCAVLSALTLGPNLFFTLDPELVIPLWIVGVLFFVFLVLDAIRLARHLPALTVSSEGIVDQASAYLTGFGLIRWHEIMGTYAARGNWRKGWYSELVLVTRNDEALRQRQPPFKRPFLYLISQQMMGNVHLSWWLLDSPPAVIAERVYAYVKTHAPTGFLDEEPETEQMDEESDGKVIH